jgi:hypothetical protein
LGGGGRNEPGSTISPRPMSVNCVFLPVANIRGTRILIGTLSPVATVTMTFLPNCQKSSSVPVPNMATLSKRRQKKEKNGFGGAYSARQGKAKDKSRQDMISQEKSRQEKTRQDKTRLDQ